MDKPRFQFTLQNLAWAVGWLCVGLAVWRLVELPRVVAAGLDNLTAKVLLAFLLVPQAGIISSFRNRPLGWAVKFALWYWLVLAAILTIYTLMYPAH